MKAPLVSGILTFANPQRLNLARKAVNNFIRQHYTPYELIVVNGTDLDVLTNEEMNADYFQEAGCSVREIKVEAGKNAAVMKNLGIEVAKGEWIIPIDDDDWFHPQRLIFQMAHRQVGRACLLKYQLRVDVSLSLLASESNEEETLTKPLLQLLKTEMGVASTIMFPRLKPDGTIWIYDGHLTTGEHAELIARMSGKGLTPVVVDNSHTPFVQGMQWPLLSIAIYHAGNELTHEQFFHNLPLPVDRSAIPLGLTNGDITQLGAVLQSYNFKIQ